MKKKQFYEKPAMQVVKLQQQQLLAGSVLSTRPGYGEANSEVPVGELEGEIWLWN